MTKRLNLSQLFEIAQSIGCKHEITLDEILNPKWDALNHGSWADYLCDELKNRWKMLPEESRVAAYIQAAFTSYVDDAQMPS